jgi:hypothetical protein
VVQAVVVLRLVLRQVLLGEQGLQIKVSQVELGQ